ncbi:hypothetical protein VTP01DRAFT_5337 [Rhizomucor pusillus]|uniref:uncharacterized protein n=1 Tax=Rhizomucor pusillus TaxID=4840 RepID=UPI00374340AB
MSFITFIKANPALAPLFVVAGAGCAAAVSYPMYLLRTHPEILIDRKNNPEPWNRVQQHQNIKVRKLQKHFFECKARVLRGSQGHETTNLLNELNFPLILSTQVTTRVCICNDISIQCSPNKSPQ